MALILLGIIGLFGLCAYGYWRYIYYPTTPEYALGQFFEAAKARDYDRVYDLVQVPAPLRLLVRNGQDLKQLAERVPSAVPIVEDYRFGRVTFNGDHAIVDTSTIARNRAGRPYANGFDVEMIRTNGVWRIDGYWILKEIDRRGLGGLLLGGPGF